jgi:Zn-finger nucleic acid-binding protein
MTIISTSCPRCNQGPIVLERIRATAELIQICEECEAVWLDGTDIVLATFRTFYSFMEERGLSDRWLDELEDPGAPVSHERGDVPG